VMLRPVRGAKGQEQGTEPHQAENPKLSQ
jgi:hypothetical protein